MAWTASKSAQADEVSIRVKKGNELTSLITETHNANEFQATLADGKDRDKAIRVETSVAALGARGDYILLEIPYTLGTGTADTRSKNSIYVEVLDITGVSTAVQHALFGRYSPFPTPRPAITRNDIIGIDRQFLAVINNVGLPAVDATGTTAVSQKVRGTTDSRITAYYGLDDPMSDDDTAYLKLKPNQDGVFMIPSGAIIWIDNSDDGMGETGA